MSDFDVIKLHERSINKLACYQQLKGKRVELLRQQMEQIPFVANLSVLDIGCNNGLHSLVASKYCPLVTGVEEGKYRAHEMQAYFEKHIKEYNPDRVTFLQCPVSEIQSRFSGILAFNVLYHLGTNDLKRATEIIRTCERVVVQSRKKVNRRSAQNDLYRPEKVLQYLKEMGFFCTVEFEKTARPIILGQK